LNPDYPIIVGFGGKAGVGKTMTAEGLVPQKSMRIDEKNMVVWDHLFFALPLYELITIKRDVQGDNEIQRQLYLTMEKYLDIFGSPIYGAPDLAEVVELVYETVEFALPEDPSIKPREFMQVFGTDKCRALNPDVWVEWMKRTVNRRFAPYKDSHTYVVLLSDVRFPNEAQMIMDHPNGLMIKLDASESVRQERLARRDANHTSMTKEQAGHKSETLVDVMPFDVKLDTNNWSLEDQIIEVHNLIRDTFRIGSLVDAN